MAIAVLRSQDCLRDRFPRETLTSFPSSFQPKHGRNPNRTTRSGGRRKRSPSDSESDRSSASSTMTTSMVVKFPAKDLVMGQVKILKRGEGIVNNTKNEEKTRSEGILSNTKKEGKSRSEEILSNTKKTVEKSRSEVIFNKKKKEEKSKSDVETKVVEIAEKMKLEVSVVSSNDNERLGPEPEMIPKGIRLTVAKSINGEIFAGSVFDSSPSPNSLPFPTFTSNKRSSKNSRYVIATKDLRRILGINIDD